MDNRSTIFHINSKNRSSGSIYDFNVYFGSKLFALEPDESSIKIDLIQAVILRSFYCVDTGQNSISLQNLSLTGDEMFYYVKPGNYNVKTLMVEFQRLFPNLFIGWNEQENKYYFSGPDDDYIYRLSFIGANIASCFGFDTNETINISSSTTVKSSKPINMEYSKVILLNSDIPRKKFVAVDNVQQSNLTESNILLKIPINEPPWATMVYRANSTDIVSFELSHNKIDQVRFWITNEYGDPIILKHDYTFSFKITYLKNNDFQGNMLKSLEEHGRIFTFPCFRY